MEREKAELAGKISAQGVTTIDDARALAAAQGPKLLKDIGAEFTRIFAGMAEYHRPRKGNKHGNATKFMEYARLAMQGAKEFAQYESPKLSAVMIGADVLNEIEITGGLPDAEDGGLQDAAPTIDESGEAVESLPAGNLKAVNE